MVTTTPDKPSSEYSVNLPQVNSLNENGRLRRLGLSQSFTGLLCEGHRTLVGVRLRGVGLKSRVLWTVWAPENISGTSTTGS